MRPIKFRVWGGTEGYVYFDLWSLTQQKDDPKNSLGGNRILGGYRPTDLLSEPIEQFTGLTDSEKTDIYEGDRLEWFHGDVKMSGWPVFYSNGAFKIDNGYGQETNLYTILQDHKVMVISHIHQPPTP